LLQLLLRVKTRKQADLLTSSGYFAFPTALFPAIPLPVDNSGPIIDSVSGHLDCPWPCSTNIRQCLTGQRCFASG